MKTKEEIVKDFTLFSDIFFNRFFKDNDRDFSFLISTIIGKELIAEKPTIQHMYPNLKHHSAIMDAVAKDKDGNIYDVEVQSIDEENILQRARFYSAALDFNLLNKSQDYKDMSESYVIFITSFLPLKIDEPLLRSDRVVKSDTKSYDFNDGSHIIFVNGRIKGNRTKLERLIHDFHCKNPEDMYNESFKNRARYLKSEKGQDNMCKDVEEYAEYIANERAKEVTREVTEKTALEFLKNGVDVDTVIKSMELPKETILKLKESLVM